jgi:hypothetical protein
MFKQIAENWTPTVTTPPLPPILPAAELIKLHPFQLVALLEHAWNQRIPKSAVPSVPLGHPFHRSDALGFDDPSVNKIFLAPALPAGSSGTTFATVVDNLGAPIPSSPPAPTTTVVPKGLLWHHLIYAYMIENTRIYEVFRRVVHEMLHGEKLGVPNTEGQRWLRNTEELFYSDPAPFSIIDVSSHLRSDLRASRRNAYQRMFGMDLNHGSDDGTSYPYIKADTANNAFVSTLEELLREVWVGITYFGSLAAPNLTDNGKIAALTERLHDMLLSRRQNGNLSREEFAFVSAMSWFHLTIVTDNLPIFTDLQVTATGAEQRLFKIAEKVGLPAHGLSKSYFDIAEDLSSVLILIETGFLNTSGAASGYYTTGTALRDKMNNIITHWSIISGRDLKISKVAPKSSS